LREEFGSNREAKKGGFERGLGPAEKEEKQAREVFLSKKKG